MYKRAEDTPFFIFLCNNTPVTLGSQTSHWNHHVPNRQTKDFPPSQWMTNLGGNTQLSLEFYLLKVVFEIPSASFQS